MLVVSFVFTQIRRIRLCAPIRKFSSIVFTKLLRFCCLFNVVTFFFNDVTFFFNDVTFF